MRKLVIFLLCLGLLGSGTALMADEPSTEIDEDEKISEMPYRKVVILGEGIKASTAFHYANTYRAVAWYKENIGGFPEDPSPAMKELILELEGINDTGEEWEFVIPEIGEKYFFRTLKNMDDDALSKATGTVLLSERSEGDESIEKEVQRVSGGTFVVKYWLLAASEVEVK